MEKSPVFSKAEIRTAALQRRDALAPELRRNYSQAILTRILATEQFLRARTVMGYSSIGSEFDTELFLLAVLESGKQLLLPRVDRAASALHIYEVHNLETDLRAGVWGIREPDPETCEVRPAFDNEFILVPGVAFDRHGGRIGHGKGYYDKLLARCQTAFKVAAAFEVQVFDLVPMEAYDVRIDMLVTEAGSVDARISK
jgi:5-formyltetrahydrofolate cyclo-ligase